jgi:hypothetical protein
MPLVVMLLCLIGWIAPRQAQPLAEQPLTQTSRSVHAPVVVIVMENHSYGSVMHSSSARYFHRFARRGTLFTHYHALHHPSLPNYLEMTSGTTSGCRTDSCPQKTYRTDNIFHQLTHADISWRAWQESMGSRCRSTSSGTYAARHNPPVFYRNLFPRICARHDITMPKHLPSMLPSFTFLTPNLCHDAHDCSITTANAWLHDRVPRLLRRGATVIVVFDEGTDSAGGGGHIYAAAAGAGVRRGVRDGHVYSHRSLLAGLERRFSLPRLHGAKRARPLPIFGSR